MTARIRSGETPRQQTRIGVVKRPDNCRIGVVKRPDNVQVDQSK